MPKVAQNSDLALRPRTPNQKLYRWIHNELRTSVLEGRLAPGIRLPSSRGIARQYGVSRGTIVAAFAQLLSEGVVESRVGSGTFVRRMLPEGRTDPRRPHSRNAEVVSSASLSSRGSCLARHPFPKIWSNRSAPAFRIGLPALGAFPTGLWSRIGARRFRQSTPSMLSYGDTLGYRPLRSAIAQYLGLARGIKCTEDEVVITTSTQQSLDLVTRLLLDPGDGILVEDPGYPGAVSLFRASGARVVAVPVDEQGLDCAAGRGRYRGARMAYVTPSCQFPLGVTMSLSRRLELLTWAKENNAWVFEDDYDGVFRFSGRPLAALRSLDASGCVIYSNSFNKLLFPTLRLGFLLVPPRLVDAVTAAKSVIERFPPFLEQAILCDFITEGHFGRHIRRMREMYSSRLGVMVQDAREKLSGLMDLSPVHTGLQAIGWLADGIDDAEACRLAAVNGIDSVALSTLTLNRSMPPAMLLGVASADDRAIHNGIEGLATVLRSLRKGKAGR